MTLLVNKIIPLSLVDGPGARFVVFTQGCNMACTTCHNPQTRGCCDLCGQCIDRCIHQALAFNESHTLILKEHRRCRQCGACIALCPRSADPEARRLTSADIMKALRKSRPFIRGVTLSGGEASLQAEGMLELFTQVKNDADLRDLTTFIDTNGAFDQKRMEPLLAVTDGVMLDLKAFDAVKHQDHTAMALSKVLDNLKFLHLHGKLTEIRILIIPGFNDDSAQLEHCAHYLTALDKSLNIRLLAYRHHGVKLGAQRSFAEPTDQQMASVAHILRTAGLTQIVLAGV